METANIGDVGGIKRQLTMSNTVSQHLISRIYVLCDHQHNLNGKIVAKFTDWKDLISALLVLIFMNTQP